MHPTDLIQTRRHFFDHCGLGLGQIALASLLSGSNPGSLTAAETTRRSSTPAGPHFAPKARAVIQLFMGGAPSHLELFDNKPELAKFEGRTIPAHLLEGQRFAFIRSDAAALGPRFSFARHGQSGAELSEVLPHLAKVADDLCIVRSVHTEQFNHGPGQIFCNTGAAQPGRPSIGAWATYGLGAENSELPSFAVLSTGAGNSGGSANWGNGFLPSSYAGVLLRNQANLMLNVANPAGVDERMQRDTLDLLSQLNTQYQGVTGHSEVAARIASYELAYRMQSAVPDLTDLSGEGAATLAMYGAVSEVPSFARACLLARRMVERGVRFVSIFHSGWDAHSDVAGNHRERCDETDQASAALVTDLKARGLLGETLVIWGGEFGRTPMVETNPTNGRSLGRDHHPHAFTMWFAGGGVKAGLTYGRTDELGFQVAEDKVHIHDIHATVLHLLGLDHERLTYRFSGRDFRLTDVHGHVVHAIIA